jgi:hypothetical protein
LGYFSQILGYFSQILGELKRMSQLLKVETSETETFGLVFTLGGLEGLNGCRQNGPFDEPHHQDIHQ